MDTAIDLAARATFDTDDGRRIMTRLIRDMKAMRFALQPLASLEPIEIAGRAWARRLAAQVLNDTLDETLKVTLTDLLQNDPELGQLRLTIGSRTEHPSGQTCKDCAGRTGGNGRPSSSRFR